MIYSKGCNELFWSSKILIRVNNYIHPAFDLKISLQFFSFDDDMEDDISGAEDDSPGLEDDTSAPEDNNTPESANNIQEPQNIQGEGTSAGAKNGGHSNPLVEGVRGKLQNGFDNLGKDKLNELGGNVGSKISDGAKNIGKNVGGNLGKGIQTAGNLVGNKGKDLGNNVSNKIGNNNMHPGSGNAVKKAGDQAYDVAADAAAIAAGKAAAAASGGVPLVDKATEVVVKKVLKSKATKKALKYVGIALLGLIVLGAILIFLPIILLLAMGSEVLYALLGAWNTILSGFFFFFTFGMYDKNFSDLVEAKLDKIYSSTQKMPKEVVKDPSNVERPVAPKSTDAGDTDKEYTEDVATNIPRERMKKYVEAEYSAMLYLQLIDLPNIGTDGTPSIGTSVPAVEDEDKADSLGEIGASILDAAGNAINNLIIDIETVELDLPTLYNLLVDEKEDGISFLEKWNLSLDKDDSKGKISEIIKKYKDSVTTTYDTEKLSAVGNEEAIRELKETLSSKEQKSSNKYDLPEGIESILQEFPTTESFFAPLEYSTGNPIIYRDEEVVVYKEYVLKENGVFDEEKSVVDIEKTKKLEETISYGDIISGNPPEIKYNYPTFFSDESRLYDFQKLFSGGRVTNFEDNNTRAFVMDIARLVYSNPEHRIANTPTNITLRLYPHSTITTTTTIEEGTYTDSIGNIVTYSVPKTVIEKETKPEAFIVRIEDWDRIEEYSYAEITANNVVSDIQDASGNIIGTQTINEKYYKASDLPKLTVTSFPQRFTDEYKLDEGDFGIYEETTGRKFLSDEVLYDLVTSEEYMAAFANSDYATPLENLPEPSSYFGPRILRGQSDNHIGVDFPANTGTPVCAIADGTVTTANSGGTSTGYGIYISIDHANGVQSRYAHLSKLRVKVGQSVKKGDVIGFTGNTGNSTGPHLHFEIRLDGTPVNPLDVINSKPLDTSP